MGLERWGLLLFVDRVGEATIDQSKFATVRRTYIKLVPREGAQWSFVVHVKQNFLLLELFSHPVCEDAARGNQKLSRSRCS